MKIAIIGHYPPPGGGVNVHIQRLYHELSRDNETWVIDPYSGQKQPDDPATIIRCGDAKLAAAGNLLKSLGRIRPQIVHFHLAAMNNFLPAGLVFMIWARLLGAACIITIHSGSFGRQVASFGRGRKLALRALIALSSKIITVNADQRELLQDYGLQPKNAAVIPAFLPPQKTRSKSVGALVDRAQAGEKTLYLSSGYGLPLYGFHHIIEAMQELKDKSSIKLVLCIYNKQDDDYLTALSKQAQEAGLDFHMTSDLSSEEFSWLLSHSQLYIRATDRDGDAVAIREAQHYGVPVIASNCVPRPAFAELFESENTQSLLHALEKHQTKNNQTKNNSSLARGDNPLQAIKEIYASVATKRTISHETNSTKPQKW